VKKVSIDSRDSPHHHTLLKQMASATGMTPKQVLKASIEGLYYQMAKRSTEMKKQEEAADEL